MWKAVHAQDETVWTEDYAKLVLSSYARKPLPPQAQHFGSTAVTWFELDPGVYAVRATGGTQADREFARTVVGLQLLAYGMEPAEFVLGPSQRKTAAWDEVMEKAQRLREEGAVQVHRNGANNIVGTVQGDHGTYQCEIGRDDPSSQVITTWQCECPWDQFAWQRTRQWKKYEGRVCSHVLALFWDAQKLPLDMEYDPATGQPIDPNAAMGQGSLFAPGVGGSTPPAPTSPAPGTTPFPAPAQLSIPGIDPNATAPPPPPGTNVLPPPPMPMMPPPTSVPGAKVPTPENPTQYPGGTFSSVRVGNHQLNWQEGTYGKGLLTPEGTLHTWTCGPGGSPHHHEMLESLGREQGLDHYLLIDPEGETNLDEETMEHVQSIDPRLKAAPDDWHFSRVAAAGDVFNNSDMVRLNVEEMGIAEGKSEAHGAGEYRNIAKNSIGEVLGQDPTTGWVDVIFPIHDSGPMQPYHIRAWIEPDKLTPMPNIKKPGPFIKRRRESGWRFAGPFLGPEHYVYHLAPSESREDIQQEGVLHAGDPGTSGRWGDYLQGKGYPEGVYVWTTLDSAMNSAMHTEGMDIWRIDRGDIRGTAPDPDAKGTESFVITNDVPAELHMTEQERMEERGLSYG
jgi:hypothetical protein